MTIYKGMIPSPDQLGEYEKISPGFADRIIRISEKELDHRQELERQFALFSFSSIMVSFAIAGAAVAGVCYLCYLFMDRGYATQGASLGVGVIVAIALAFLIKPKPNPPQKV